MAKENNPDETAGTPAEVKTSRWNSAAKIATGVTLGIAAGVGISIAVARGGDASAAADELVRHFSA
jgi:hypothetical protein